MGALLIVVATLAAVPAGCTEDPSAPETISRDRFIAVYTDLRRARTGNPNNPLPPATRDRVLQEHGVSAQDLLTFVEVHGDDLEFMEGVWEEVDRRISGGTEEGEGEPG